MDYYDPGFNGTDGYWRYPIGDFLYTDSVQYFCIEHKAYWILDVIASYQKQMKGYPFLVLYFDVEDDKCLFYVKEDSDLPDIIKQKIEYTDLKVSIKLFWEGGVCLFPSDH